MTDHEFLQEVLRELQLIKKRLDNILGASP